MKRRVNTTLEGAIQVDQGVQEEYRIKLGLLQHLDADRLTGVPKERIGEEATAHLRY